MKLVPAVVIINPLQERVVDFFTLPIILAHFYLYKKVYGLDQHYPGRGIRSVF